LIAQAAALGQPLYHNVTALDEWSDVILKRMRQELQREPRWWPWVMLASAACTFVSLLGGDPSRRFGGPVLYFVVLGGSGALVVLSIVLLVLRARTGAGDR
jgi:hypothetical protein